MNSVRDKWWFWAGGAVLGIGAVWFLAKKGRAIVESIQERQVNSEIDSSKTSKSLTPILAQQAAAAFNPSGTSWLRYTDGTTESALYKIADAIKAGKTSWSDLSNTYKKQYHRNLLEDLTGELGTEELAEFWRRAGKQFGNISSAINVMSLI